MNNLIPELSFKEIEKGDSYSINLLKVALSDHGFFSITEHGLSKEEYIHIKEILNRDPNYVELGIFSVMWSEHCSYKSSKYWLKKLPSQSKIVIQGLSLIHISEPTRPY